jgi:mevalonate kinase
MARSCAKAILLGEHAVVHGVPAIAVGLEQGARAEATPAPRALLKLGDREVAATESSETARGFAALLAVLGGEPARVEVTLEVPAGVGLGASAAIGVAIARAVLELHARPLDLDLVVQAALAWERVFHGNPSGVDVHAAAHGGCLRFVRGEGARVIPVGRPLPLALAVAGPAASTRVMVEGVARLREKKPEMVGKAFEGIRSLVENAAQCIASGDHAGLGKLMDLNQMILSGLFVSTEEIETACRLARDAGALGAKLTGAGGGGCVVALTAGDPAPVLKAWRSAGLQCFTTIVATNGAEIP